MPDDPDTLVRLLAAPTLAGIEPGASLYCVIDAASDERIYPALRGFAVKERIVPLYVGDAAVELAAVAPYLVQPVVDGSLLAWLLEELQDVAWGILAWSPSSLDDVRRHFRRLSRVRAEDGRTLLFRYYDPRVLATFLPLCDSAQIAEAFGPIALFGAVNPDNWDIALFAKEAGTLQHITMSLEPAN